MLDRNPFRLRSFAQNNSVNCNNVWLPNEPSRQLIARQNNRVKRLDKGTYSVKSRGLPMHKRQPRSARTRRHNLPEKKHSEMRSVARHSNVPSKRLKPTHNVERGRNPNEMQSVAPPNNGPNRKLKPTHSAEQGRKRKETHNGTLPTKLAGLPKRLEKDNASKSRPRVAPNARRNKNLSFKESRMALLAVVY